MPNVLEVTRDEFRLSVFDLHRFESMLGARGITTANLLTTDELDRGRSYLQAAKGEAWLVARAALRWWLAQEVNAPPESLRFEYSTDGKPRLAGSSLEFNYSHSGNVAALVTSRSGTVGVDIEVPRKIANLDVKAQRFLSESEFVEWSSQPPADRSQYFLRLWVGKESLAKALGGGLQNQVRGLQVSCRPARVVSFPTSVSDSEKKWALEFFECAESVGAVCYQRSEVVASNVPSMTGVPVITPASGPVIKLV